MLILSLSCADENKPKSSSSGAAPENLFAIKVSIITDSLNSDSSVDLDLEAQGASEMYITNDSFCHYSTEEDWIPYKRLYKNWSLRTDKAEAKVYVKFRNRQKKETKCLSDHVTLNLGPKNPGITVGNSDQTSKTSETIFLSAQNAHEMLISNAPNCSDDEASWLPFEPVYENWPLGTKNGIATVYAKFRDKNGLESLCVSDSILHDNEGPKDLSLRIKEGSYTAANHINLLLEASNSFEMFLIQGENCSTSEEAQWRPFQSAVTNWPVVEENKEQVVSVRFRDHAGNESECIEQRIIHDNTAPAKVTLKHGKGHNLDQVHESAFFLQLESSDTNFKEFRYTLDGSKPNTCTDGTPLPNETALYIKNSGTLNIIACDYANNQSELTTQMFRLNDTSKVLRYKDIEVLADKIPSQSDLTDFPLLISFSDPDLINHAGDNGEHIAFFKDENPLDYEIEDFNPSLGRLTAWVRVANLSASENSTIRMYYGDIRSSKQNPNGVWNDSYSLVWHLSGKAEDSTKNNADGEAVGSPTYIEHIGRAMTFDGIDDKVNSASYASHLKVSMNAARTVSTWAKVSSSEQASPYGSIFQLGLPGGGCCTYKGFSLNKNGGNISFGVGGEASQNASWSHSISYDQWYHYAIVYDGLTNLKIYRNGALIEDVTLGHLAFSRLITSEDFPFGLGQSNIKFTGSIDETRVSTKALSADWIKTSYQNQSAPSSFYRVSEEQLIDVDSSF